jgi:hypothetical protein
MTLRAEISRGYLMRLGLVGLFCAAGGLWFLYDGLVGYPEWRERGFTFEKFVEDNTGMDELDLMNKWNAEAREKGWPEGNPLDPETNKPIAVVKVNEQFYYAGAALLAGLGFLSRFAYMFGRWIECDDTTLRDKSGREARYADITELNKKKWQSKGIAFVSYKKNGGTDKIRIDDFYFDREPTRQILRKIEANIDPALITNGKPEPPEKLAEEPAPQKT